MDLIIANEVVPAVNQIEVNPLYQRYDDQKFLEENKVQPEAWAPFAEMPSRMLCKDDAIPNVV